MNESNESRIARAEIRQAIEKLVYACVHNNAAVAGYVWGTNPPIIVRFGNIKEKGPELAQLLLRVNDLTEEIEMTGNVIEDKIKPEEK